MHFSALLDKIKGAITNSQAIAVLVPIFCFLLINLAVAAHLSEAIKQWLPTFIAASTTEKSAAIALVSVGICVLAYLFSSSSQTLREVLEGRHLSERLARPLRSHERKRFTQLGLRLHASRSTWRRFIDRAPIWEAILLAARQADGHGKQPCTYTNDAPAAKSIAQLETHLLSGQDIQLAVAQKAVSEFTFVLLSMKIDFLRGGEADRLLDAHHQRLRTLLSEARARSENNYISLYNEREFDFSRYTILPTRLGNISESVRSYALSRYGLNVEFFWGRFQKAMQPQTSFLTSLQDAKVMVDFAVACCCLTAVSTLFWLGALPFTAHTWELLLVVLIAGPLATLGWYYVAIQNYRAFSDFLRTAIDTFRFKVIQEMECAPPDSVAAERDLWQKLNRRLAYGEADIEIKYRPPGVGGLPL